MAPGMLHHCRPGVKLAAFASLSAAIMGVSLERTAWWWAMGVVCLALWQGGVSWRRWLVLLRRLSLLFASLILFHGFFVPGHWVWELLPSLTREGLQEGGEQCLRLVFLASLAWALGTTTTPWQIVSVAHAPWLGPRWQRALAILAMSLRLTGRLTHMATEIRESLRLREGIFMEHGPKTWATVANILLWKALLEVQRLEQALWLRGFSRLPAVMVPQGIYSRWGDGLVTLLAFGTWWWVL